MARRSLRTSAVAAPIIERASAVQSSSRSISTSDNPEVSQLTSLNLSNPPVAIMAQTAPIQGRDIKGRAILLENYNPHLRGGSKGNEDEIFEEYAFSSEPDEPGGDDFDDVRSHISLSSDGITPQSESDLGSVDERPWRSMTIEDRRQYECMFTRVTHPAVGGSWSYTEDYQLQVDKLMLKYMEDFPLPVWVIGQHDAQTAYAQFIERSKWRSLGIKVYGPERLPELIHGSMNHPLAGRNHATGAQNQVYGGQQPSQTPQVPSMPPQYPHPTQDRRSGGHSGNVPAYAVHNVTVPHGADRQQPQQFQPVPVSDQVRQSSSTRRYSQTHASRSILRTNPADDHANSSEVTSTRPSSLPRTPPYQVRDKPNRHDPNDQNQAFKTGRRNIRKAEAEHFPWNREMDFTKAKAEATWDDSCYDPGILKVMAKVRRNNESIIKRLDREVNEKQRLARSAKRQNGGFPDDGLSDAPTKRGRKKRDPRDKRDNNDPYHSGNYAFATSADEERAQKLGERSPDDIIAAGEADKIPLDMLGTIKIYWDPGKKGITHDLQQAPFSTREAVLTRKQLLVTPILTRAAADHVIDFCPDLLWRDMLLRICSEAGCGNKDVRDRFCLNGCHADKATFTKRISAALGQKQTQSKSKSQASGEVDFYEGNQQDFKDYIEFFGTRATHRNMKAGAKRRYGGLTYDGAGSDDDIIEVRGKRAKTEETDTSDFDTPEGPSSDAVDDDIDMTDVKEDEDGDAVSAQDSDALDDVSD